MFAELIAWITNSGQTFRRMHQAPFLLCSRSSTTGPCTRYLQGVGGTVPCLSGCEIIQTTRRSPKRIACCWRPQGSPLGIPRPTSRGRMPCGIRATPSMPSGRAGSTFLPHRRGLRGCKHACCQRPSCHRGRRRKFVAGQRGPDWSENRAAGVGLRVHQGIFCGFVKCSRHPGLVDLHGFWHWVCSKNWLACPERYSPPSLPRGLWLLSPKLLLLSSLQRVLPRKSSILTSDTSVTFFFGQIIAMFGGYFFIYPLKRFPLGIQSQSMSCQDRRGWPHGGHQWHATSREGSGSLGSLVVVSFSPKQKELSTWSTWKEPILGLDQEFFLEYFGHFCFHKLGGGWGRQLERVLDSLWKHRKCPKTSQKVKDLHELPICAK